MTWIPLVYGEGPLTPANGFHTQGDVVTDARRAGTLMGATPMDRPEDVEISPTTGHVFICLTKNADREEPNAANPRPHNQWGQVLELIPENGDHAALTARWDILLLGGDPKNPAIKAQTHPETSENGWLSCPDNGAFDTQGHLWITTDGAPEAAGFNDALYACAVEGPYRGYSRQFYRVPIGAEPTGPCFSPDNTALFLSVQHPGEEGGTFQNPPTRWPDFKPNIPPRPSVVVITKEDSGIIGTS
jgi:hypothetical protein